MADELRIRIRASLHANGATPSRRSRRLPRTMTMSELATPRAAIVARGLPEFGHAARRRFPQRRLKAAPPNLVGSAKGERSLR